MPKDRIGMDLVKMIIIIGTTETKGQEYIYRDSANVEYKIYDCTSNNGVTGIVTEGLWKNLEAIPR